VQELRDATDPNKIPADKVPQSTYCLMNGSGDVLGMVRVRHKLNEQLLQYGGNIGYYMRPFARGKGCAKIALRLALAKLRELGFAKTLLTVHPQSFVSARVVITNGGVQDTQGKDPVSGLIVDRYWIEM
jgi:predicted acetyltransferase